MNLISQNPYRVLGLLGNSSERELQKQIDTINRFAEVGKTKSFDYDFDFLGAVSRTANDVQKASSQIEQANNKLNYSLFWFVNKSHIDEIALNHLKENNTDKAIEIWEKTIKDGEVTSANFSSITNLATLLLGSSIQNGKLDTAKFQKAIELKGRLIHSNIFSDFVLLTAGNGFTADISKLSTTFTEEILTISKKHLDKEGGISNAELIQSFTSFPENTRKYLSSKFIEEPLHSIESQIEKTVERRKLEPENAGKLGSALYATTKNDLAFLKSLLGSENVQYQMLSNKVANEILQCAIDFFIEWKDDSDNDPGQESLRTAKLAKSVAPKGQTKNRVKENIENIEDWIENGEERRLNSKIGESVNFIIQKLNLAVETLENKGKYPSGYNDPYSDLPKNQQPHNLTIESLSLNRSRYPFNINLYRLAGDIVSKCKPALEKIKLAVGGQNQIYLKLNNDLASISLACLIEYVNNNRNDVFATPPDVSEREMGVMNAIGTLEMNSEMRKRFNSQKQSLLNLKLATERLRSKSSDNSGGCYIATMAYGNYDHPQVLVLRDFRDDSLAKTAFGRNFIRFYYATSPKLVALLKNHKRINAAIRLMLDQLIKLISK